MYIITSSINVGRPRLSLGYLHALYIEIRNSNKLTLSGYSLYHPFRHNSLWPNYIVYEKGCKTNMLLRSFAALFLSRLWFHNTQRWDRSRLSKIWTMTNLAISFSDLDGNRTNVCIAAADLNKQGCAHTTMQHFTNLAWLHFCPCCNNGCNLILIFN